MSPSQQSNKSKIFCRASSHQRGTAGLVFLCIAVLFVLFALAGHYEIPIWSYGCGFKQKYDLPCPGCGVTTSTLAFTQGGIFESFYIQPAAAVLCSVLAGSAILAFFIAVFGVYFTFLKRFFAKVKIKYIILALIIIFALGWAVTLSRAFRIGN